MPRVDPRERPEAKKVKLSVQTRFMKKGILPLLIVAGTLAGTSARADEIQFTTLPQVVQSSVIKQTRITSPSRVVRVVQDNGIYGVTVMTDTGQQVVYVNPTGEIVQSPTVTQETTTTTTTEVPDQVVTTQEIQQAPSRYELIEKKGNKEIYLDHQTGRKVKVERK